MSDSDLSLALRALRSLSDERLALLAKEAEEERRRRLLTDYQEALASGRLAFWPSYSTGPWCKAVDVQNLRVDTFAPHQCVADRAQAACGLYALGRPTLVILGRGFGYGLDVPFQNRPTGGAVREFTCTYCLAGTQRPSVTTLSTVAIGPVPALTRYEDLNLDGMTRISSIG